MQDEDIETQLAADFEIGHFIRERLVPKVALVAFPFRASSFRSRCVAQLVSALPSVLEVPSSILSDSTFL